MEKLNDQKVFLIEILGLISKKVTEVMLRTCPEETTIVNFSINFFIKDPDASLGDVYFSELGKLKG